MSSQRWWMRGLLFENCSCQLVCPAHLSFKQQCTYERCRGHWAAHIEEGCHGETPLGGLNIVVVFDSPRRMYDGNWLEVFYIDERATTAQRRALETIFSGQAGGPWEVMARFVGRRLESRFLPMRFQDEGRRKSLRIEGVLETQVEAIRSADGRGEAVLENLFNQIHGPVHVLARGKTRCRDASFDFSNEGSHGLYSHFSWEAGEARA